ncbi:MAG: hypothetical protein IKJ90_01430 [Bacteroidaceae bacterium]|nr:hypothetical protein [Bacteroidaceae bacterium]
MFKFKIIAITLALFCINFSYAQKNVSGEAQLSIYLEDSDITPAEAKRLCIEKARKDAIIKRYGQNISAFTKSVDINRNGQSESYFKDNTYISSNAEWLRDTKEPEIIWELKDSELICTAKVWGIAKEKNNNIKIDWKIFVGGADERYEGEDFNDGQKIYIKVKSPIDGYLAVYLKDDNGYNTLLPYKNNRSGQHLIKGGETYILFNKEYDKNATEYKLGTSEETEFNDIIILFSPNKFTKCTENKGNGLHPNTISPDEFEEWENTLRINDNDFVFYEYTIKIHKDSQK